MTVTAFSSISAVVGDTFNFIQKASVAGWERFADGVSVIVPAVRQRFANVVNSIGEFVSNIGSSIADRFGSD